MADIGRINHLLVEKTTPQGIYLQGGWLGQVLLPKRFVPKDCEPGDYLDAFIYLDSEDRFIATTQKPKAQVGEVAYLECVAVNQVGAFLDWGLPKELLVPYSEQHKTMTVGKSYVVYVYSDEATHRIAASTKLNHFIGKQKNAEQPAYQVGQAVELLISDRSDIGYNAVINHRDWGVLFYSDVVNPLTTGRRVKGFIKRIRDDGKIDLALHAPGFAKVDDLATRILNELHRREGFLPLSDVSPPEQIYQTFNISKRVYKMAIGALYKKRLITIEPEGIRLIDEPVKNA